MTRRLIYYVDDSCRRAQMLAVYGLLLVGVYARYFALTPDPTEEDREIRSLIERLVAVLREESQQARAAFKMPGAPSVGPRPIAEVETGAGVTLRLFEQTPETMGLLSAVCGFGGMR